MLLSVTKDVGPSGDDMVTALSNWAIPLLVFGICAIGLWRKVNIYDAFIEGAAQGFKLAVDLIPYFLAMMVAINIFQSSGAMTIVSILLKPLTMMLGIPSEVLPLAILRPLSGGGALGVATELIHTYGPDSFIGRLASTMQGTSDTTFFVLTLYFGSVGIKNYRYALALGLTADVITFLASVFFVQLFFGY